MEKLFITEDILALFAPSEGLNRVYYGQVRNGKTYAATADIVELLEHGEVVYANWRINWQGYDERKNWGRYILKRLLGRGIFFNYSPNNFHYFAPDDVDVDFLGRLVGVHVFIDEGQWLFNSHVRDNGNDPVSIAKRRLILHGGHYCRTLNIVTQRPSNIMKDVRSQIHVWYKCVKRLHFGSVILFQRWEYQNMKDDLPDEDLPVGRPKTYWASKRIFSLYNTHGMREEGSIHVLPELEAYAVSSFWSVFKAYARSLGQAVAVRAPRVLALRASLFGRRRDTRVYKKDFIDRISKSHGL